MDILAKTEFLLNWKFDFYSLGYKQSFVSEDKLSILAEFSNHFSTHSNLDRWVEQTISEFSSVTFAPCFHIHSSLLGLNYAAKTCRILRLPSALTALVERFHTNARRLGLAVSSLLDFPELPVTIDYGAWVGIGSWIFSLRIKISSCLPVWDAPCWPTCWVWCEMCFQALWPYYPPEGHACRAGRTHCPHLFIPPHPLPIRGLSHLCFQLLFFISLH